MPQLTSEQLARVEAWAAEGANLNQIQDRLKSEFALTLTYLEARLLMADVGVRLKDKERPVEKPADPADPVPPTAPETEPASADDAGSVNLSVDAITAPGTLASGKVTFSDGVAATWYVDQMGRLGLGGAPQGYQPPPADVPVFQQQLDRALMQAGF
jgi:hypothetical protein